MAEHQHPRKQTAEALDALTHPLFDALESIDRAIAQMSYGELFDRLEFVRKYGDLSAPDHAILYEKLEKANAAAAARGDDNLDIHLRRPDPPYRRNWHIDVMAGHIIVAAIEFPTFEESKAAFDALSEFIRIAGREGQFTYETPRPDGCTFSRVDGDELPF